MHKSISPFSSRIIVFVVSAVPVTGFETNLGLLGFKEVATHPHSNYIFSLA